VNHDLNRYAFLVVLVHEFAHYTTFQRHRRHAPHGPEWKAEYHRLMQPFLSPAVFPPDLLAALQRHLEDPPGSSCTDRHLMRTLRRYDPDPGPFLEELLESTVFRFQQKLFVKGPRMRTRYKCKCLNDERMYLIDPTSAVHVEQVLSVREAT
jgi:predicted SprT family Zn-dependent metalloprotease